MHYKLAGVAPKSQTDEVHSVSAGAASPGLQRCAHTLCSAAVHADTALAAQLVQSRTFGAAGKGREVVRMLVPLVDFFNHRGDESAGPIGQDNFPGENARYGCCLTAGRMMQACCPQRSKLVNSSLAEARSERKSPVPSTFGSSPELAARHAPATWASLQSIVSDIGSQGRSKRHAGCRAV